ESTLYDRSQHLRPVGAVSVDRAAEIRDLPARLRERRHQRWHAFLRNVPAGENGNELRRFRPQRSGGPGVLALEASQPAGEALLSQAALVKLRETEGPLPEPHAGALNPPPHAAPEPAQVFAPVVARPDLVPVDDEAEAAAF